MQLLFPWRRRKPQPTELLEVNNPEPKEKPSDIDPIGQANQLGPMEPDDRKTPAAVVSEALRAAENQGRAARYQDFTAMLNTSDIAAMVQAVVDAAVTFEDVGSGRGFKVESDDKKVEELLNGAKRIADLDELIVEVVRDIVVYGDSFVEPLFDKSTFIGVQTYPPQEMVVAKNDKGRWVGGVDDNGFPIDYQQVRNGSVVAGWNSWEMIHFKYEPMRRRIYSNRSLLDPLRADWRKLQLVEQGMVIARVTRAYPRRIHYLDVTNKTRTDQEEALKSYINRMTKRAYGKKPVTDDGMPVIDVSDDLYITTGYTTDPTGKLTPSLNRTEIEDPATAGLTDLGDVNYLRAKLFTEVPSDVVGVKRNQSTDLDSQDVGFTRLVRRVQAQVERGLRGIFDQVLLANGILPGTRPYRVTFPTIDVKASWKHSDARFRASMTLRNYLEMGAISRRFALKQAYNLSDLEIDALWEEILAEMTNPVFQTMLAPARDGLPSITGAVTGQVSKAGNDGTPPAPSAPQGVTKSGVDRTTDLGQKIRGNLSGG